MIPIPTRPEHPARPPCRRMLVAVLAVLAATAACRAAGPGQEVPPRADALPAPARSGREISRALGEALAFADGALRTAVRTEAIPGAVLLVARDGHVLHEKAYGSAKRYEYGLRPLSPPPPMTAGHLFDLASVTKVMATTYAIMLLVDRGLVDVDAPVHTYLPDFRGPDKDGIRIAHLLRHTSGLHRWKPVYYHATTPEEAWSYVRDLPLEYPVGEGRHYSDLGFMMLGRIVEQVTGRPLDEFLNEELYAPLELVGTGFNPKSRGLYPFAATSHGNPYERRMVEDDAFGYRIDDDSISFPLWRDYTLEGEVNDGNAFHAWGGVAGHAGLFSTARDLATLLEVLLDNGRHRGRSVVAPEVVHRFLSPDLATGNGLGWAVDRVEAAPGDSVQTFSHSGFTGTFVLGAPGLNLAIVLLTNRQNLGTDGATRYPDVDRLRAPIVRLILRGAAARPEPVPPRPGPV